MISNDAIKRAAREVGFDACGVAPAKGLDEEHYQLRKWISQGWHAGLEYMERNVDKRLDPRLLVPGARSVISVVRGYNPSTLIDSKAQIARYAYGDDYHVVIKQMLIQLAKRLGIEAKACCDTVPISDKHWAAQAGLGWIGRHTLLVTPEWGSWVNLGELVTTEECDRYDSPIASPCHDCGLCVAACPNHALAEEGPPMIDLRRCIAYHTIESREDEIPATVDTHGYAFGCDLCQQACPHNQKPHLKHRDVPPERLAALEHLSQADEEEYRRTVKHSAMSRVKYAQWRRNIDNQK